MVTTYFSTAVSGNYEIKLPQWGRCFWQDPNDGKLFLAFASGANQLAYITSANSGVTWSAPSTIAPIDDFTIHNNFDVLMDSRGHAHCAFRYNGSGCYKLVGKIDGGLWTTASGESDPVGFNIAGDSGNIRGLNGSLFITEARFTGDVAVKHPLLRAVAKTYDNLVDSYYLGDPFKGEFTLDSIGGTSCGIDGGFPIGFNDHTAGGPSVTYYNSSTNAIAYKNKIGGVWDDGSFIGDIPLGSGHIQYGTNMAIGSGSVRDFDGIALVCCSTGNDWWALHHSTSSKSFGRVETSVTVVDATGTLGTDHIPWRPFIPRSGIFGVNNGFPGSGTNCDFSVNDDNRMVVYFQKKDESGRQSLVRFLAHDNTAATSNPIILSSLYGYPSGARYLAAASNTSTGGFNNKCFYNNFKACRHPGATGVHYRRGQFVATQGHASVYPSGAQVVVWNAEMAPEIQTPFSLPYYNIDYTATSGTARAIFSGVTNQSVTTNLANMFDRSTSTFGLTANGSSITMMLDSPRVVDRIEVVGDSTSSSATNARDIGEIKVWASFDNVNYSYVGAIPSGNASLATNYGRLRSLTTDEEKVSFDNSATKFIQLFDAISAKYIRLNWTTTYANSGRRISEIRVFGPGFTSSEIRTLDQSYFEDAVPNIPYGTERFVRQRGEIPPGWRTYGDFTWYTVASGELARGNNLPSEPLPDYADGKVPSGIFWFVDGTNGNGDGFSLISEPSADASGLVSPVGPIPAGGIGPGHSGVIEVDILVDPAEVVDGISGRTVSFDLRVDPHGADEIQFFTITDPVFAPTGVMRFSEVGNLRDWTNYSFFVPYNFGDVTTLRWVYNKGSSVDTYAYGAAWIDNLVGLDGQPRTSVKGYLLGSVPYETGIIYGFLEGKSSESILGYLTASAFYETFYGYVEAGVVPDITDTINGYVFGNTQGEILGYLLGASGTTDVTYPTGQIYGYVACQSGSGPSQIYGYVEGDWGQTVYGYTAGYATLSQLSMSGDATVYGYLKAYDAQSSILGIVNSSGASTSVSSINGYLDSRFGQDDQTIYGYVFAPIGGDGTINGYSIGWNGGPDFFAAPQSIIFGFVGGFAQESGNINGYVLSNFPTSSILGYLGNDALVASGGGAVGDPSTSNVVANVNRIYGYLKGISDEQTIYGYVHAPPGVIDTINGYVLSGASQNEIFGYSRGYDVSSTGILGFASGLGYVTSSTLGYLFAVSGIESSTIYGLAVGEEYSSNYILGTLIGSPSGTGSSKIVCPSHNMFPLPPVQSVTIPTGFYLSGFFD